MKPLRTWLAVAGIVAIGDQAFFVVLSLSLLSSYGSGIAASFLTAASVARLALILVGGWAADRWSPYRCIQVGLVLRIASFLIVGLDSLGGSRVPVLSCGVVLFGTGDGLYLPSSGALLKRLSNHGDFSRTSPGSRSSPVSPRGSLARPAASASRPSRCTACSSPSHCLRWPHSHCSTRYQPPPRQRQRPTRPPRTSPLPARPPH